MLQAIKVIDPEIESLLPSTRELGIGIIVADPNGTPSSSKGSKAPKMKSPATSRPVEEILAAWEKVGEVLKSRYLTAK